MGPADDAGIPKDGAVTGIIFLNQLPTFLETSLERTDCSWRICSNAFDLDNHTIEFEWTGPPALTIRDRTTEVVGSIGTSHGIVDEWQGCATYETTALAPFEGIEVRIFDLDIEGRTLSSLLLEGSPPSEAIRRFDPLLFSCDE